jgi:hypothetical protein
MTISNGIAASSTEPRRLLPPGYIHLGVAKEIEPTLRDFGLDPDPVIREVGLDPDLFDNGANVIPHVALGRLLTLCVARTNCPHFGLLVGRRATILSLGMVGRLMQHSATVGEAMRTLVSNLSIQNRGAVPTLTIRGDTALFSFAVYQSPLRSTPCVPYAAPHGILPRSSCRVRPRRISSRSGAISGCPCASTRRSPRSSSRLATSTFRSPEPIPCCALSWKSGSGR